MTSKKLHLWEAALMVALAVTLLSGSCASARQSALAGEVLRLHVIANSDSRSDQALKLQVRDAVLAQATPLLASAADSAQAEAALEPHLEELAQTAQAVLARSGCTDTVTVSITDHWFPTREYEDFSLPAGQYRALRVVIGEGEGQNWWCVVFPPLCLGTVTETSTEAMGTLSDDHANLITGQDGSYVLKFKLIEWWEQLRHRLGF